MVQKPDVIEKKKNLEKDSNLSKNIEFHGSETFEQWCRFLFYMFHFINLLIFVYVICVWLLYISDMTSNLNSLCGLF